jgi:hypothetical protein
LLFDMDNDGYKDIYVCNGIYHDLTNQFCWFLCKWIHAEDGDNRKKRRNKIINKMPSTAIPNYAFKKNKN